MEHKYRRLIAELTMTMRRDERITPRDEQVINILIRDLKVMLHVGSSDLFSNSELMKRTL